MSDFTPAPRPHEFALLLLAGGDTAPRRRARDQQADSVGLALRRRLLEELIASDPEPELLEAALLAIVEQLGPPLGPTRSIARLLLEEWTTFRQSPVWQEHLAQSSLQPIHPQQSEERHGRQLPG